MKYCFTGIIEFKGKKNNTAQITCPQTQEFVKIQKANYPHIFSECAPGDMVPVVYELDNFDKKIIVSINVKSEQSDIHVINPLINANKDKINQDSELPPIIPTKEAALHLYLPWSPEYDPEQMHKIKNKIQKHGSTWVGKLNISPGKNPLYPELDQIINNQIIKGHETRLYMTDFNSIHVFEVESVTFTRPENVYQDKSVIDIYKNPDLNVEFWIKIKDVYVLAVDHKGNKREILEELALLRFVRPEDARDSEKVTSSKSKVTPYVSSQRYPALIYDTQEQDYFNIYTTEQEREGKKSRWLNSHRSMTESYYECAQHLHHNVYPELWEDFSKATQHYLTECQMKLMESASYNSNQAYRILHQAWDCYFQAVVNEFYKYLFGNLSPTTLSRLKSVNNVALFEHDFDISQIFNYYKGYDGNWSSIKVGLLNFSNDQATEEFVKVTDLLAAGSQTKELLFQLKTLRNTFQHKINLDYQLKKNNINYFKALLKELRLHLNLATGQNCNSNVFYRLALDLDKIDKSSIASTSKNLEHCNQAILRIIQSYETKTA